ncbi:tyrosine-type recombinase/integrase [Actinomycetospora corticicola]|uniref:Integrase/recombinase XerC n=1 Tax=Actinomycetospora corticicola TaxID=663602 RepID=A0A7Y9DWR2_9PSEU|nr:integrase/recombinase XerC [Actinomycetospora corticicola]
MRCREVNLRRADRDLPNGLADATDEELWLWQDELRARLAIASVRAYTSHVKQFLRWAVREGHIDTDPSIELVTPRVPKGRAAPIPEDRLRIAIACAPDTADRPLRTWLVLAAYLGLRAGEIARLTRDAIGDEVLTVDGKGGKVRTVPLPADVRSLLVAHVEGPGAIWRRHARRALTPKDVSLMCCRHLRDCGAGASLHKLRHRYATRMFELSKDVMYVKELLGHESLATTQVYLAVDVKAGSKWTNRLAEELKPRPARKSARSRPPARPPGVDLQDAA